MKALKDGEYAYSEQDFLGEGSFAKVYRGTITKNKRVVAVRLLSLKLIKQYGNKIKQIISKCPHTQAERSECLRNCLRSPTPSGSSPPRSLTASSLAITSP